MLLTHGRTDGHHCPFDPTLPNKNASRAKLATLKNGINIAVIDRILMYCFQWRTVHWG